jgi:hypothetical protein
MLAQTWHSAHSYPGVTRTSGLTSGPTFSRTLAKTLMPAQICYSIRPYSALTQHQHRHLTLSPYFNDRANPVPQTLLSPHSPSPSSQQHQRQRRDRRLRAIAPLFNGRANLIPETFLSSRRKNITVNVNVLSHNVNGRAHFPLHTFLIRAVARTSTSTSAPTPKRTLAKNANGHANFATRRSLIAPSHEHQRPRRRRHLNAFSQKTLTATQISLLDAVLSHRHTDIRTDIRTGVSHSHTTLTVHVNGRANPILDCTLIPPSHTISTGASAPTSLAKHSWPAPIRRSRHSCRPPWHKHQR